MLDPVAFFIDWFLFHTVGFISVSLLSWFLIQCLCSFHILFILHSWTAFLVPFSHIPIYIIPIHTLTSSTNLTLTPPSQL